MKKRAIILAAGRGSRMKTDLPKCAYPFCGKAMVEHIVDNCLKSEIEEILVVVGYKKAHMMSILAGRVTFIEQEHQLGTGHAVMCCEDSLANKDGISIIISGDMPLVDVEVITELIDYHMQNKNALTIATTVVEDAKEYGRIYRENGKVKKIIEFRDCTEEQKKIKEVNSSLYCVDTKLLFDALKNINRNNNSEEYYLTDIVEIIGRTNKIDTLIVKDSVKLTGINDLETLKKTENIFLNR